MQVNVGDVVVPGDTADEIKVASEKSKVILGPGLRREGNIVKICKCGVLCKKDPYIYWVDNHQKRYVPAKGENIVGIVTQKSGDVYRVDFGGSETTALHFLSFEGATKKLKPDVQVGDAIYAKLIVANKDMESEIVCVDSQGKKGRLGILPDGFVFSCSLNLVRKILNPSCPLIKRLAKEIPFEMAAGMNGKVWVKANGVRDTIAVATAILAAEFKTDEEMDILCLNVATELARGCVPHCH